MAKKFSKPEAAPEADLTDLPTIQRDSAFTPFRDEKTDKRYEALGEAVWGAGAAEEMPDDILMEKYREASDFLSSDRATKGASLMASLVKQYVEAIRDPKNRRKTVDFFGRVKELSHGDEELMGGIIAAIANVAYFVQGQK